MSYPFRLPSINPLLTLTNESHTPWLWIIELHNGEDNRLTDILVHKALQPALDIVERDWRERRRRADATKNEEGGKGALIIVGKRSQDKFFSNGLDFANASKDPNFFPIIFNPLLARLLTFPIPTVAAINGHCFAGALMLSLACDYRVMIDGKQRNAWACMNEVHFGAAWPHSFAGIIAAKIRIPSTIRKIALEGTRFSPADALAHGIVDYVADGGTTAAVMSKAIEVAQSVSAGAKTGVWGIIKMDLFHDAVEACQRNYRPLTSAIDDAASRARL